MVVLIFIRFWGITHKVERASFHLWWGLSKSFWWTNQTMASWLLKKRSKIYFSPSGVVTVIIIWNFPYYMYILPSFVTTLGFLSDKCLVILCFLPRIINLLWFFFCFIMPFCIFWIHLRFKKLYFFPVFPMKNRLNQFKRAQSIYQGSSSSMNAIESAKMDRSSWIHVLHRGWDPSIIKDDLVWREARCLKYDYTITSQCWVKFSRSYNLHSVRYYYFQHILYGGHPYTLIMFFDPCPQISKF